MNMLRWIIVFFAISVVAALLGFTRIAAAAAGIAQILFVIFLTLFVVFLVAALLRPHRHHPS
jgi:uncharacterized membrane protein YtjA (UPF0391 family)